MNSIHITINKIQNADSSKIIFLPLLDMDGHKTLKIWIGQSYVLNLICINQDTFELSFLILDLV